MSGQLSKGVISASMSDFFILQHFKVTGRPRLSDRIKEVRWKPPDWGWIKLNIDGSSIGSPNIAVIGVIFGDHNAELTLRLQSFCLICLR